MSKVFLTSRLFLNIFEKNKVIKLSEVQLNFVELCWNTLFEQFSIKIFQLVTSSRQNKSLCSACQDCFWRQGRPYSTRTSEALNRAIYHVCGIFLYLLNLQDRGRDFQCVVDAQEKSIPTLKNFTNAFQHSLQWARDIFQAHRRSRWGVAESFSPYCSWVKMGFFRLF